jgi:TonB dependent receptor/TonB-dependent Receptor Plug Domain
MIVILAALSQPIPDPAVIIVRAERRSEASPTAVVLGSDTLNGQSGLRLDEALRVVPGAGLFRRTSSVTANATIQGLSLRPIAPNGAGRALVSLDGVPQNDPFGGWIFWSRYDPTYLEKVDIKRGADGAGAGPMALTGTLELTELRGAPSNFAAHIGTENSQRIVARHSIASSGAMFTAMGAYEISGGTIPVLERQRGLADRPVDSRALSFAVVTDIERNNGAWSFRGAGFSEAKGAGLLNGQSQAQGIDFSMARRFQTDWGQSHFVLYAQGRDFSNQTVAPALSRNSVTPALDQFSTPSSAVGGSAVFVPESTSALPKMTLDWRSTQGQTQELFRYIGGAFTRMRIAGGRQDLVGMSVFLPRRVGLGGVGLGSIGLNIDGGLRLDYWANHNGFRQETDRGNGTTTLSDAAKDKSGAILTGRMSLSQDDGPMSVSIYRTFRPATLNELHRPFRIGNDVTEANAALQPEVLVGLDLNFRRLAPLNGGDLAVSLTAYVNQLDDPIANVTVGRGPGVLPRVGFLPAGGTLRERTNVGRINATGLEARLNWDHPASGWRWLLGASATDARVDGGAILPQVTGKRPAQAPRWSAIASVSLPFAETVTFSASVRGESSRFEDDVNARKLAAYGALDLQGAWQITDRIGVTLSGENVLNSSVVTALAGDGVVSLAQQRMIRLGIRIGQ